MSGLSLTNIQPNKMQGLAELTVSTVINIITSHAGYSSFQLFQPEIQQNIAQNLDSYCLMDLCYKHFNISAGAVQDYLLEGNLMKCFWAYDASHCPDSEIYSLGPAFNVSTSEIKRCKTDAEIKQYAVNGILVLGAALFIHSIYLIGKPWGSETTTSLLAGEDPVAKV